MKQVLHFSRSGIQWCIQHPLGRGQWVVLVVWTGILAGVMILLGDHIARTTNQEVQQFDQAAYLYVAEKNRGAWWPAWTDGIRNPLFPWLLANTVNGDTSAMFAAGLKLNVRLGALLVLVSGVWAGRRLPWVFAMTFITLAGPGIILPISTYLGAEVLFYGLFFAAWMLSLSLIERFTYGRCALLGVTLAIAYLAKPAVTLLTGCLVIVGLIRWFFGWRSVDPRGWSGWRPLAGTAIALSVAALIMAPRMSNSWKQFDTPLQNTSTIYFWDDNWEVVYPKLRYLNPRLIHKLKPEERPSPGQYLSKHGWMGSWDRLLKGAVIQCGNLFAPHAKSLWFTRSPSPERPIRRVFPYRGFLLLPPLALVLGFGIMLVRREGFSAIPQTAWYKVSFAGLLLVLSLGAFSWYWVIAPGARFILALYAPILASLLLALAFLRRQLGRTWADGLCAGAMLMTLGLFVVHLSKICLNPDFDRLKTAF